MKTYFITGGAGFIGSTLTKRLLNYIRYLENQFMEDNNYDTNRQRDSEGDEQR